MMGISKSTAHGMLKTLERRGFVKQDEVTRKYWIGPSIFNLGMVYFSKIELRLVAEPFLVRLTEKWNSSGHLAIYAGGLAVFIFRSDPPKPFAVLQRAGLSVSAHVCAVGKVLLAHRDEREIQNYFSHELAAFTDNTITSGKDLLDELEEIRRNGYGIENEESIPGMGCVAAPIRDNTGTVVAAISLSGAKEHILGKDFSAIVTDVCKAAADVSRIFGHI